MQTEVTKQTYNNTRDKAWGDIINAVERYKAKAEQVHAQIPADLPAEIREQLTKLIDLRAMAAFHEEFGFVLSTVMSPAMPDELLN